MYSENIWDSGRGSKLSRPGQLSVNQSQQRHLGGIRLRA